MAEMQKKANTDHIKPYATFPELRFDVSNGRALCVPCHRKSETYGIKTRSAKIEAMFARQRAIALSQPWRKVVRTCLWCEAQLFFKMRYQAENKKFCSYSCRARYQLKNNPSYLGRDKQGDAPSQ